ncbi:MAG: hypothetical protein Q8P11_03580 [bacterium]|nr:hypothetical protein [bacterium]
MWYINRKFISSGLIPEPMICLDDLLLAGEHQTLANILTAILKDGVGEFVGIGRPETKGEILAEVLQWTDAEIADMVWGLLKHEPEEIIWKYIPRTSPDITFSNN